MERIYYPSILRVLLYVYLIPAVAWPLGFYAFSLIGFVRGSGLTNLNWAAFISYWFTWVVLHILIYGLQAENCAIKITPSAIAGPIGAGKAKPIPFDEIDYQKTLNPGLFRKTLGNKSVYSFSGDKISIREAFFLPQQVSEIWTTIIEAQQQWAGKHKQ